MVSSDAKELATKEDIYGFNLDLHHKLDYFNNLVGALCSMSHTMMTYLFKNDPKFETYMNDKCYNLMHEDIRERVMGKQEENSE